MERAVATNTYIGGDTAVSPIRKVRRVLKNLNQLALSFLSGVDKWRHRQRVEANAHALSEHQMKDIGLQHSGVGFIVSPPVRKR